MYLVLVDWKEGRVLVTGEPSHVEKLEGWDVEYVAESWDEAYQAALLIADEEDFVLEWYLEDEVGRRPVKKRLVGLKNVQ
ncbi:MAG: hypothetical protein AT711_03375 [Thermoproteus sp. CIS_19]|jgi:ribonucleotide monophosphatase NagD (HAD superfamily)|nr:MAG: hypothetical protein AT711_03375 [Thermoproteus sp. CIS_19]MCI4465292.1 hypothetical protein [Thermoproteus sp.]